MVDRYSLCVSNPSIHHPCAIPITNENESENATQIYVQVESSEVIVNDRLLCFLLHVHHGESENVSDGEIDEESVSVNDDRHCLMSLPSHGCTTSRPAIHNYVSMMREHMSDYF